MCSLFWTLLIGTTSPGVMYKHSTSSKMKNHFSSTWTDCMQLLYWRVTGSILVRQKVTRSSLCCSVKAGFKADVHVIISGSSESHFIQNMSKVPNGPPSKEGNDFDSFVNFIMVPLFVSPTLLFLGTGDLNETEEWVGSHNSAEMHAPKLSSLFVDTHEIHPPWVLGSCVKAFHQHLSLATQTSIWKQSAAFHCKLVLSWYFCSEQVLMWVRGLEGPSLQLIAYINEIDNFDNVKTHWWTLRSIRPNMIIYIDW